MKFQSGLENRRDANIFHSRVPGVELGGKQDMPRVIFRLRKIEPRDLSQRLNQPSLFRDC